MELGLERTVLLVPIIAEGKGPTPNKKIMNTLYNFQCYLDMYGLKPIVSFLDYEEQFYNGHYKDNVSTTYTFNKLHI